MNFIVLCQVGIGLFFLCDVDLDIDFYMVCMVFFSMILIVEVKKNVIVGRYVEDWQFGLYYVVIVWVILESRKMRVMFKQCLNIEGVGSFKSWCVVKLLIVVSG